MKQLRILLADDHDLIREGARVLIESEPGWKVCGIAATGPEAVKEALRLRPDVAVVDLEMSGFDGLEVARRIKRHRPECEIIIFTGSSGSDEQIRDVFAGGAKSYILKTEATSFLIEAIRSVAAHKPFFTERTSAIVFARFANTSNTGTQDKTPSDERLSKREQMVIRLLAEGHGNSVVAEKQRLSVRAVENIRADIMRKLDLSSFADLVRYAFRNGMIKS